MYFGAIVKVFLTFSIPNNLVKHDHATIKDTRQILTTNMISVKISVGRGHKLYLVLVLPPNKYSWIAIALFV